MVGFEEQTKIYNRMIGAGKRSHPPKHGDGQYAGNQQEFINDSPETDVPLQLGAPCPFCKGFSTEVKADGVGREKFYSCMKCGSRFSNDVFAQKNLILKREVT